MALNITRGVVPCAQKVVVYGVEGIGKTTFASQFPDPLFIDVEGGTKHLDVARVDPAPQSWTALLEIVREVNRTRPCATLVIDTADWAERLCIAHIVAEAGSSKIKSIEDFGYGTGYTKLVEEYGRMLNLLSDVAEAGVNVVLTAHAKIRKFEQPDEAASYDRWELKLTESGQKRLSPLLKEWADALLFADYKTIVETVGAGMGQAKGKARGGQRRVMKTQHHACWDAKNRWGLPDEVPFEFAQIAAFIPAAPPAAPSTPTAGKPGPAAGQPVAAAPAEAPAPVPAAAAQPAKTAAAPKPLRSITYSQDGRVVSDARKAELQGLPEFWAPALQLMEGIGATVDEVRAVSAAKGHHSPDTPAANYEQAYIDGCIVAQWPKWADEIKRLREQAEPVPFD